MKTKAPIARLTLMLLVFLLFFLLLPALHAAAQDDAPVAPGFDYLLSSHDSIPQNQFDDYVIDLLLTRQSKLSVALYNKGAQGEALKTWQLKRTAGTSTTFNWDGVYGGQPILPGDYLLQFSAGDDRREIALTVTPPQERLPLRLTGEGEYLPLSADEYDIWEAMMAPLAVADIGELGHEPLYDAPGGKKIGHVHGQTAGLVILALDDGGYAKVGAFATVDGSYIEGYIKQKKLKMLSPNPRYGILIDKQKQSMSIYEADEKAESGLRLLGDIKISTGLMDSKKLFRETRAGAFFTQKRLPSITSDGYRYDYAIRIDGGNLLHEAGHKMLSKQKDFTEQAPLLGSKQSNGCVRMDPAAGEDGLDAFWLWQHIPRGTKVLVMDDPRARMARLAEIGEMPDLASPAQPRPQAQVETDSLMVQENAEDKKGENMKATEETAADMTPAGITYLTMSFMGDSIIGSEEKSRRLPESFDSAILEKGYAWPFSGVADILTTDDLSIINFEGVLKDDTRGREEGKLHWFRGPTDFARVLPAGSIELAGLANNHMRDYGRAGHNSTREAIEQEGVATFGYFATHIHEHGGLKIGFGGIRETIWRQKPDLPQEEIAALKAAGCDYIVYTVHAGEEYNRQHTALQTKMAHAIIDAGADLIIGAHPHVVQGIEQYKQGIIVYSLGNFSFGGNLNLTEFDGLMVQAELKFEGRKIKETTLRLIPVLTTGTIPNNDFRPIPAAGEDKARILKLVQDDSGKLKIKEEMRFVHE